jgi:hypothetical protein
MTIANHANRHSWETARSAFFIKRIVSLAARLLWGVRRLRDFSQQTFDKVIMLDVPEQNENRIPGFTAWTNFRVKLVVAAQ